MPLPTVSVIIPTYNQAEFLEDAIASVLSQTYRDYEIVVVNDGSTDNTEEIAKRFSPSIHYLYQANQGLAGARNTGILAAQGEYVALLDSDDTWDPTFLAAMMDLVNKKPGAAVYYCGIHYMDATGKDLPQTGGLEVTDEESVYRQILRANFLIPSSIVMNRNIILAVNCFDINFRRLQDWELWIRLLRIGHQFVGLEGHYLVRYRVHASNLSTDPIGGQLAARAVIEKHFGCDEGDYLTWTAEKRFAYGGLYRFFLVNSIQRQDNWQCGVKHFACAIKSDPTLAGDLDLFYELALGNQPVGYRGTASHFLLEENAKHIEELLAIVFSMKNNSSIQSQRRIIYGTAYKAIGLVAYNTGQYAFSRKYLRLAVRRQPGLLMEKWIVGCYVKSYFGKSALLRRLAVQKRKLLGLEE